MARPLADSAHEGVQLEVGSPNAAARALQEWKPRAALARKSRSPTCCRHCGSRTKSRICTMHAGEAHTQAMRTRAGLETFTDRLSVREYFCATAYHTPWVSPRACVGVREWRQLSELGHAHKLGAWRKAAMSS